jgi:hypothetical protein
MGVIDVASKICLPLPDVLSVLVTVGLVFAAPRLWGLHRGPGIY